MAQLRVIKWEHFEEAAVAITMPEKLAALREWKAHDRFEVGHYVQLVAPHHNAAHLAGMFGTITRTHTGHPLTKSRYFSR